MKKRLFTTLLMALMVPFMMQAQQKGFVTLDTTVCGSFLWSVNNETYTQSGIYTYSDENNNYALNLTVNAEYTTPIVVNESGVCSYRFGSTTFYTDTVYSDTLHTQVGNCDSVVSLHLTVASQVSNAYERSSCGPFLWEASGETLTTAGTYTCTRIDSLRISAGNYKRCDSVLTLTLSIMNIEQREGHKNVSDCDKVLYKFRDAEINFLTFYEDTTINSNDRYAEGSTGWQYFHKRGNTPDQCYDTVSYVHIEVRKSSITTENVKACDSYTFDHSSYTYETVIDRIDTLEDGTIDTISHVETINTPIHMVYTNTTLGQKFYVDMNEEQCSDSIYLNVTINASPSVYIDGDINLQPGNNGTVLYAHCNQDVAYQWFKGNTSAGTADSLVVNALSENTDFSLVACKKYDNNYSCYDTTMVTVTVNEGIGQVENSSVRLYPNPACDHVLVECGEAVKNVTLYNTLGQRVLVSSESVIKVSSLSNGTYAVRIETESGKVIVRSLVVKR